jgi:SAM-dependent methyltransferase
LHLNHAAANQSLTEGLKGISFSGAVVVSDRIGADHFRLDTAAATVTARYLLLARALLGASYRMHMAAEGVGVFILNVVSKRGTTGYPEATAYKGKSKLEVLMGPASWDELRGRSVLDFGCGQGHEAVEAARRGASTVVGIDLRYRWLQIARAHAAANGVSHKCVFARDYDGQVERIICLDSFEHFAEPAAILQRMADLLHPSGKVLVTFGPTWYHPLGGHIFSVFPWSHLVFPESVLVKWRSLYKSDGARSFREVGLNGMTIQRFCDLVEESPLRFDSFEVVPIRRLRWLHYRMTREFTTAILRCALVKR